MEIINWYKKHNFDLETIGWIEGLRNNKPYTDKEIIKVIEKICDAGEKCGLTLRQSVALVASIESDYLKFIGNIYKSPKLLNKKTYEGKEDFCEEKQKPQIDYPSDPKLITYVEKRNK